MSNEAMIEGMQKLFHIMYVEYLVELVELIFGHIL